MHVTRENHPHTHQRHEKSHSSHKGFAECFADTAARHFSKSGGHGHCHHNHPPCHPTPCHGHGMPYHGMHWQAAHGGGCFGADGNHIHGGQLRPQIRFVERCDCHHIKFGRLIPHRQEEQPKLIVHERLAAREGDMSDVEWENLRDRETWPDERVIPWTGVDVYAPKRPKSIRDIPARALESELLAAQQACRNLRTEGLTKTEIFRRIESIYIDFLGKDFRDAIAPSDDPYENTLAQAALEFQDQLNRHDPDLRDPRAFIDMKRYTGMSESEMRAAVRAQYPETMTLRECMTMAYELRELGLEEIHYGNAIRDRILSTMGMDWSEDVGLTLQAMLDMPADFDTMKSMYDASTKDGYTSKPAHNMNQLFKNTISWFGGNDLYTKDMSKDIRGRLDELEKNGEKVFG